MQAISGAGPNAIAGMDIIDNLIPYIPHEESKLILEVPKILGKIDCGKIEPARFGLSATCLRAPILDGHTAVVTLQCEKPFRLEEAKEAWSNFTCAVHSLELPSAPYPIIEVLDEKDRPQPRLDRMRGEGRRITIGRVRTSDVVSNGLTFVVVGHNRRRGTFGNTILNAELLFAKGLLHKDPPS
jgi:aspartate-semialdehyde dehydrogenase